MLLDCAVFTGWPVKQSRGCPDPESAQAIFDQTIEIDVSSGLRKEMTFEPPFFQAEKFAAIASDPKNPTAIDMQIVHKSILKFSRIAAIENSEIYAIKAHQPFSRSQPQITCMVLNNGQNRIVRQSTFSFPGIQGILGDFPLWIQTPK
jgi:hypothetical protein